MVSNMKDFGGKTALVTGGASGIGLALGQEALKRGMNLVVVDVDPKALSGEIGRAHV